MSNNKRATYRARRLERERQRRLRSADETARNAQAVPHAEDVGRVRRAAAKSCGWCGGPVTPGKRGPIAKWCSATCRHRAWEQTRAAASGLSAVQVVERQVEVLSAASLTRRDWPQLLLELARQLDDGRIYDRDLPDLSVALTAVLEAYGRRPYVPRRRASDH